MGDIVLYEIDEAGERRMLFGTPIEEREPGDDSRSRASAPGTARRAARGRCSRPPCSTTRGRSRTSTSRGPGRSSPCRSTGSQHDGAGELDGLDHLEETATRVVFNIDGCSWVYDGRLRREALAFTVERVLVGQGELDGGVLHGLDHDPSTDRFVVAFCAATSPTQLHVISADDATPPTR